jgi:hypothetical protein
MDEEQNTYELLSTKKIGYGKYDRKYETKEVIKRFNTEPEDYRKKILYNRILEFLEPSDINLALIILNKIWFGVSYSKKIENIINKYQSNIDLLCF